MERPGIMGILTDFNPKFHSHLHLQKAEAEHIVGNPHPDVIGAHMDAEVEFVFPDKELEIDCAGRILGGAIVRILDVDHCLTAEEVFSEEGFHMLPLVKPELAVDTPTIC